MLQSPLVSNCYLVLHSLQVTTGPEIKYPTNTVHITTIFNNIINSNSSGNANN